MKIYQAPRCEIIDINPDEHLLALSSATDEKWKGTGDGVGEQYSERAGWNSENWNSNGGDDE